MLLLSIRELGVVLVRGDVEQRLSSSMGESYGKVLGYSWIDLPFSYKLVKLDEYEFGKLDVPVVDLPDQRDKFSAIIDKFSNFDYVGSQSDPRLLFTAGGNCQAVSLYLYETFKANGFEAGLGLDLGRDHMYDWVIVNNQKYKVDLVNKVVEAI